MRKWLMKKFYEYSVRGRVIVEKEEYDNPRNGINSIPKLFEADRKMTSSSSDDDMHFKSPMHITIYNANGGRIVKFHYYNEHDDRRYENTYIVTVDENFENALAKFIAMENIKHASVKETS